MSRVTFHEDVLKASSSFSPTSKQKRELPGKSSLPSVVPSSRRCICGKILPWFHGSSSSHLDDSNSSLLPKAMSALDELYQKSFEKDKMKRLATFDLIQSLQDDCFFRPRQNGQQRALGATRRNLQAKDVEDSFSDELRPTRSDLRGGQARERLLRGDWCFDCARKHASGTGRKLIKTPRWDKLVDSSTETEGRKVLDCSEQSHMAQISDSPPFERSTSTDAQPSKGDLQPGLLPLSSHQEEESYNSLRFTSDSSSLSFNFSQQVEKDSMWLSSESDMNEEVSKEKEQSQISKISPSLLISEKTDSIPPPLKSLFATGISQDATVPREALRMESVLSLLSLEDDEDSDCDNYSNSEEKPESDASNVNLIPSTFEGLVSPNSFGIVALPPSKEDGRSDEFIASVAEAELEKTRSVQGRSLSGCTGEHSLRQVERSSSRDSAQEEGDGVTIVDSSFKREAPHSPCTINEIKVDFDAKVSLSSLSNDEASPIQQETQKPGDPSVFASPPKGTTVRSIPMNLPFFGSGEFHYGGNRGVAKPLSAALIRRDSLEALMRSMGTPSSPNDVRACIKFDSSCPKNSAPGSFKAETHTGRMLNSRLVDETFETILVDSQDSAFETDDQSHLHGHTRVVIVPRLSTDPTVTAETFPSSSSSHDEVCLKDEPEGYLYKEPTTRQRTCAPPAAPCLGIQPLLHDAQEAARNLIR